jgi:predicted ATPase with chaperone activity
LAAAYRLLGSQNLREFCLLSLEGLELLKEIETCTDLEQQTMLMRQLMDVIKERSHIADLAQEVAQ